MKKTFSQHSVWYRQTLMQKHQIIVFILITICILMLSCSSPYHTFYVRMDGNDANSGLGNTPKKAWASLPYAVSQISGGDHLYVQAGEYIDNTILIQNIHGTAERPTVIKAIDNLGAVLSRIPESLDSLSVVYISNCSYLQFEGFEIYDDLSGNESGIDVRDSSHHVILRNNYIHDCACGGISSRMSDYLTIENNIVRDNAKRNKWNCSGISVWHPIEVDQEPGFHIIIRGNVAFENECELPFTPLGHTTPTDGNGIIVDDYRATQQIENALGQKGGFKSGTLIENNLCFNNGGRGINVFKSDNVTIRNNTSFHNMRVLHKYGDFSGDVTIGNSHGLRFYNNIIVQNPDYPTSALRCYDNDSTNTKIFNNIFVGDVRVSGQSLFMENNKVRTADEQNFPRFINPTTDVTFQSIGDFQHYFDLLKASPARDAATANFPPIDLVGHARPFGDAADIGCFEFIER